MWGPTMLQSFQHILSVQMFFKHGRVYPHLAVKTIDFYMTNDYNWFLKQLPPQEDIVQANDTMIIPVSS